MIGTGIPTNLIAPVVSFVLSGVIIGAVYALLKLRPEAGQFTVNAAKDVVLIQSGVIEGLRSDLDDCGVQIKLLKAQAEEVAVLRREIERLREDILLAHRREERLKRRVLDLEAEVTKLKNGTP